jgi:hypothetical protein
MEGLLSISLLLDGRLIASDATAFSAGAMVIVLRTAAATELNLGVPLVGDPCGA